MCHFGMVVFGYLSIHRRDAPVESRFQWDRKAISNGASRDRREFFFGKSREVGKLESSSADASAISV